MAEVADMTERHLFTIRADKGWRCILCKHPEHHAIHIPPKLPRDEHDEQR